MSDTTAPVGAWTPGERAPLPETPRELERGRVLVFAPHADDDVIGCGGTAAIHAQQGDPVKVVIVYDGTAGDPERRYSSDELRALRQREARAGGRHLGLADYEFWGYPEGHEPPPELLRVGAERVAALVRSYRPRTLYAPWIGEHHLDHHVLAKVVRLGLALARERGPAAVSSAGNTAGNTAGESSRSAVQASRGAAEDASGSAAGHVCTAWGFEVWTPLVPTRIVDITRWREAKVRALEEHRSQLEYTDHVHKALGMQAQRSLYLPAGSRYGEAFAPLGSRGE
jgi:LmbE family N-acetylglucosaminyl deacetylase